MRRTRLLFARSAIDPHSSAVASCLLYLYDVAVDSGEAKVLRQVSSTEHCDVERLLVR